MTGIRRCDLVGVGVALLEWVWPCWGGCGLPAVKPKLRHLLSCFCAAFCRSQGPKSLTPAAAADGRSNCDSGVSWVLHLRSAAPGSQQTSSVAIPGGFGNRSQAWLKNLAHGSSETVLGLTLASDCKVYGVEHAVTQCLATVSLWGPLCPLIYGKSSQDMVSLEFTAPV